MNAPTRRVQARGFSLLEMTLVILIMGILGTVAIVAFAPTIFRAKVQTTKSTMQTIKLKLDEFNGTRNTYPANLTELVGEYIDSNSGIQDGWGQTFHYTVPGLNGQPYDLISSGEDKNFGTPDDISIWNLNQDGST